MVRRLAIASTMLLVAGCSREERVKDGVATDDGIAAIALPEEQYRDLLKRSFLATQTGGMTLAALGLDEGCRVLESAVDASVERGLPQWRANLIAAYRKNVPADQLAQAVQKSPRAARSMVEPYADSIGSSTKELNSPLLEHSTMEVMGSAFSAVNRMDKASRTTEERQKDLAKIKTADEICGVRKWQRP